MPVRAARLSGCNCHFCRQRGAAGWTSESVCSAVLPGCTPHKPDRHPTLTAGPDDRLAGSGTPVARRRSLVAKVGSRIQELRQCVPRRRQGAVSRALARVLFPRTATSRRRARIRDPTSLPGIRRRATGVPGGGQAIVRPAGEASGGDPVCGVRRGDGGAHRLGSEPGRTRVGKVDRWIRSSRAARTGNTQPIDSYNIALTAPHLLSSSLPHLPQPVAAVSASARESGPLRQWSSTLPTRITRCV